MAAQSCPTLRGVVSYPRKGLSRLNLHDRATREQIVSRVAALLGLPVLDVGESCAGSAYVIPGETLLSSEAGALGVIGPGQILGGIVPHEFVGTKAITHGLISDAAHRPAGWIDMDRLLDDVVLPGFTAFSLPDLETAARTLLVQGPIRLKHVFAKAGLGQFVIADEADLQDIIARQIGADVEKFGVVVELDLSDVTTWTVGWTTLAALTLSYVGSQQLTTDNFGRMVYGGSDLIFSIGPPDILFEGTYDPMARQVIEQAIAYDRAAHMAYPAIIASRRNYDIAVGALVDGRYISGVLEQSWRIGGATGAEIAAFERFMADPELQRIRAVSREIYGEGAEPPAGASIYYQGVDPVVGPLLKYAYAVCDD